MKLWNQADKRMQNILFRLGFSKRKVDTKKIYFDERKMASSPMSRDLAEEFARDLRKQIERQVIGWAPLSPDYQKKKVAVGLDPRILIATRRYIDSIQAVEDSSGGWRVTVPDEPLAPNSKYTLKDLARWLEYGTSRMPARPHWRPILALWKTKVYYKKQQLKHTIYQRLRGAGFR